MILKNLTGIALLVAGLALALAGFRRPDVKWFVAGCVLSFLGVLLIRRRNRGDWMQGPAGDDAGGLGYLGDLGDSDGGHHSAGGHSSGHLDLPSIDFDN